MRRICDFGMAKAVLEGTSFFVGNKNGLRSKRREM